MGDILPAAFGVAGLAVQQQLNVRDFKKQQAKIQAKIAEIQAEEVTAAGTEELNTALGNINAALVGNMRDPAGPTASALRDKAVDTARSEITRQRTNILLRRKAQRRAANFEADTGFVRGTTSDLVRIGQLAAGAA